MIDQKWCNYLHDKILNCSCMCSNLLRFNPPILSNSCCSSIQLKLVLMSMSCIWTDLWHFPTRRILFRLAYKVCGQSGNMLPFLGILVHEATRTLQSHLGGNQMQS